MCQMPKLLKIFLLQINNNVEMFVTGKWGKLSYFIIQLLAQT